MLGETQRKALFHFLDSLSLLLSESIKKSNVRDIESRLHHSLAQMERDFPMTLQVMCGYHYCIATDVVLIYTAGYHNALTASHTGRNISIWARLWHMDVAI